QPHWTLPKVQFGIKSLVALTTVSAFAVWLVDNLLYPLSVNGPIQVLLEILLGGCALGTVPAIILLTTLGSGNRGLRMLNWLILVMAAMAFFPVVSYPLSDMSW